MGMLLMLPAPLKSKLAHLMLHPPACRHGPCTRHRRGIHGLDPGHPR